MIAVPFTYFSILLIYIIKTKKAFDISAYLVSIYLVSSFFSILIDLNGLRSYDTQNYTITWLPTFLYCFLLTLTIWPFYQFKSERIISIRLNKPKLFNTIVYIFFACFLVVLFSSFASIIQILNGDANELRGALYRGESITESERSYGPLTIPINILGGYSMVMLLFYFYSITFLKRSKFFNTITLLSSLTIILIGILGIDRSKTIYWLLTFGLMIILFWRHLSKKKRKKVFKLSAILMGGVLVYFFAVTVSRFGERDTGTEGGIIAYAGQSFINFCFFFDMVEYRDISLQRIFPLFYKLFVDNGIESTADLNADITLKTGKYASIFSTFIGDIMMASGKWMAIIYCVIFNIIVQKILYFRNTKHIYFYQILIVFCLISIPLLGLFAHFYNSFLRTLALLLFLLYAFNMRMNRFKNK